MSAWESVYLSGLFFLCILFWTEAAVGSRLARPPSHTEGLQYCSDVMFLRLSSLSALFDFSGSIWSPPVGSANLNILA